MSNFKKILFLFCLTASVNLSGSSCGNPAAPALIQEGMLIPDTVGVNVRMELENTYTENERLVFRRAYLDQQFAEFKASGRLSTGAIIFNVRERADFYVKSGPQQLVCSFLQAGNRYCMKSKARPAWQGGAKIIVAEIQDWTFTIDGRYVYFHAKADEFLSSGAPLGVSRIRFCQQGWQASGGISYSTGLITPYAGFLIRNTKLHIKHTPFFEEKPIKTTQKHKGGLFVGASLCTGSYFFLSCEVRLINERSFSFVWALRF